MTQEHTITVKEFRMWLQGVEEMQETDWVPTASQWQRIRQKIDTISEISNEHSTPIQTPVTHTYPHMPAPAYDVNDNSLLALVPTPAVIAPAPPGGMFATPESPTIPVRTPNIDTANGSYKSAFA